MTLQEINTPVERRRAIRYGADGNKVVHRWYEVQHVTGPIYIGNLREDEYHQPLFDLFLFYDGIKDGFYWQCLGHPDWYTLEKLEEALNKMKLESKESYLNGLENAMEASQFVGNADIEFVRQWNPERADVFAAYRLDRLERQREKERQHYLECQAKKEKEKSEEKARLLAEKAKYLGWADKMTPMKFGRVNDLLGKLIRQDGKVMTRREFVISAVKDGWLPDKTEDVFSYYGGKWDKKKSKPKTIYKLSKGNLCYTVNKTEYDFAEFIASMGMGLVGNEEK